MIGRLVGCVVLALASLPALADDINFSDLQRPGGGLSRSAVVPGLAAEGASFVSRFSEVDTSRVEDLRRSRAAAASYSSRSSSSSSASSSSKKSAPSNKTFICTIYCVSASGPKVQHEVKASSKAEAARYMSNNSDQICKSDGLGKASSASFSENQCREK